MQREQMHVIWVCLSLIAHVERVQHTGICRTGLQTHSRRVLYMHPHDFDFRITGRGSDLLESALLRSAAPDCFLLENACAATCHTNNCKTST